eukprot:SAG11_NODE_52_length_19809_cov_14.064231_18_plen_113_part_00
MPSSEDEADEVEEATIDISYFLDFQRHERKARRTAHADSDGARAVAASLLALEPKERAAVIDQMGQKAWKVRRTGGVPWTLRHDLTGEPRLSPRPSGLHPRPAPMQASLTLL